MTDHNDELLPRRVALHHVGIAVTDLEAAVRFWTRHFGFSVRRRFEIAKIRGEAVFVGNDQLQVELWRLADTAPVPEERRLPNVDLLTAGTKHLALVVPALGPMLARLKRDGVTIVAVQPTLAEPMRSADGIEAEELEGGPVFAAFIHDPFGSLIELWDERSSH